MYTLYQSYYNIISEPYQETGVSGENHRPATGHWQTLSHKVVSYTPCHESDRHWLHR